MYSSCQLLREMSYIFQLSNAEGNVLCTRALDRSVFSSCNDITYNPQHLILEVCNKTPHDFPGVSLLTPSFY